MFIEDRDFHRFQTLPTYFFKVADAIVQLCRGRRDKLVEGMCKAGRPGRPA